MRLVAAFPVHISKRGRKLIYNLDDYKKDEYERRLYLVCKNKNNKDILAISPKRCKTVKEYTVCDGTIINNKCTGCLACQIKVATPEDGVNRFGIPTDINIKYTYSHLSKIFFNGKYIRFPSNNNEALPVLKRFNEYTGEIDERNFTNPLIAAYLWSISMGTAFVFPSPSYELSIDVPIIMGEREGHLDVTLKSIYNQGKYLLVVEGKRNVKIFLQDSIREQNKKYEDEINKISRELGFNSLFTYVIGGNEDPMYPPDTPGIPKNIKYQRKFFDDILKNNKRYITIHALRGLGVLYISSRGKRGLENIIYKLFENKEVHGLVLGGAVTYDETYRKFVLKSIFEYI